jgi:hypothetical protein
MQKDISAQNIKGNCFDWSEYWRLEGEFGIKRNYILGIGSRIR